MAQGQISITINAKDMEKLMQLPPNTIVARKNTIKRMTTSLSQRLRFKIPSTFGQRGKIGVTGSLSNPSSWRATATPSGDGDFSIEVTGPAHAGYINRPQGPYPFEINLQLLRSWLKSKGKRTDWGNVRRLAQQIRLEGHRDKRGTGAIEEAVFLVQMSYGDQFAFDVNTEFNNIFK